MDTIGWTNYGKFMEGDYHKTNLLYTPKMNISKDILCMSWDINDPYQYDIMGNKRAGLTDQLMSFFFSREVENINVFKSYKWSPNYLEIDNENKKIFFEWNTETCNDIINKGQSLSDRCPDWKSQLHAILNDIVDAGYYKMSLYPHCFFIDKHGVLKTFDFYACVESENPFLEKTKLEGMMGNDSNARFIEAQEGKYINFELFFKQAIKKHIIWPEDALASFYKVKFNEQI